VAIYVQDMRASGVMRTMIAFARFMMQEGGVVTLLAGHAAGHFRPKMSRPPLRRGARPPVASCAARHCYPAVTAKPARAPDVVSSGGNFGHISLWAASHRLGIPIVYCFSNAMVREGEQLQVR
jgi:hypothetical protein